MTKLNFIFCNDCAADGCYRKKIKGGLFCKTHQAEFEQGKDFTAHYGRSVLSDAYKTFRARSILGLTKHA